MASIANAHQGEEQVRRMEACGSTKVIAGFSACQSGEIAPEAFRFERVVDRLYILYDVPGSHAHGFLGGAP